MKINKCRAQSFKREKWACSYFESVILIKAPRKQKLIRFKFLIKLAEPLK